MTTNPDEPQVPGGEPTGATPPPPPPAPSGYEAQTPPVPPAGGYGGPPPAGGYTGPPPAAPAYGAATAGAPLSDSDQRLWATLAHIGGLILSFVAPLVIWLIYKDRGRFVEEQAKEALNFQITLAIIYVIGIVTTAIIIGVFILIAAAIGGLILMILAAVAANKGEAYRYPVNIRLVK